MTVLKTGPYAGMTEREAFTARTKSRPSGCVEWAGPLYPNGYGRFTLRGRECLAHRKAVELHIGAPVAISLVVMHTCDNKKCVSPEHLVTGTQRDNVHDALRKNRLNPAKGERAAKSKLSARDVQHMRDTRFVQKRKLADIAAHFGVSQKQASVVTRGVQWAHVPLSSVMQLNINKLLSRQQRGVLGGDGDKR